MWKLCLLIYREVRQLKLNFFNIFSDKEQSETLLTRSRGFVSDMSCMKYELKFLEMAGMLSYTLYNIFTSFF